MNAVYGKIFGLISRRERRSRRHVYPKTAWWRSTPLPWNKKNKTGRKYKLDSFFLGNALRFNLASATFGLDADALSTE